MDRRRLVKRSAKALTSGACYVIVALRMEVWAFFLCLKTDGFSENVREKSKKARWKVVRVRITLACTECKQRNYNMTKEKKLHPDRMETKKYCRFCKKHTLHKETK